MLRQYILLHTSAHLSFGWYISIESKFESKLSLSVFKIIDNLQRSEDLEKEIHLVRAKAGTDGGKILGSQSRISGRAAARIDYPGGALPSNTHKSRSALELNSHLCTFAHKVSWHQIFMGSVVPDNIQWISYQYKYKYKVSVALNLLGIPRTGFLSPFCHKYCEALNNTSRPTKQRYK